MMAMGHMFMRMSSHLATRDGTTDVKSSIKSVDTKATDTETRVGGLEKDMLQMREHPGHMELQPWRTQHREQRCIHDGGLSDFRRVDATRHPLPQVERIRFQPRHICRGQRRNNVKTRSEDASLHILCSA